MAIHVNDQTLPFTPDMTLSALLHQLDRLQPGTALAVNQTIIPRAQWETHQVQDGDAILLFQAIAGG
ncbi:sulfur carrier protein ThiS [Chimaeribacter arupi]|jgi:sulfur carrier protein|uniref:Sulfur carrier protein ThiS n=2 Tax=Yersiniaceae TaxID=1903411 RepID=A0A2N5EHI7_9GAMM|nr:MULTISPECIES: sulfur carrier protein ThiS [Yersiniaceae]MBS0971655.1 sulfur carrier protein ThiS [Nissabacter archeti]MDV5142696.1 sulfur carrier protein ThiS [Chimaeribacter arupi]PLR29560.1 sulfur carrier protein ThiS [Chimaeribacter arupi]PLR42108.1 sulfur carrier protein ThiS [Chimaeribacter arupi]PLR42815.1 sulfur carrier protein ThiS [Chimaeribacter arupi]